MESTLYRPSSYWDEDQHELFSNVRNKVFDLSAPILIRFLDNHEAKEQVLVTSGREQAGLPKEECPLEEDQEKGYRDELEREKGYHDEKRMREANQEKPDSEELEKGDHGEIGNESEFQSIEESEENLPSIFNSIDGTHDLVMPGIASVVFPGDETALGDVVNSPGNTQQGGGKAKTGCGGSSTAATRTRTPGGSAANQEGGSAGASGGGMPPDRGTPRRILSQCEVNRISKVSRISKYFTESSLTELSLDPEPNDSTKYEVEDVHAFIDICEDTKKSEAPQCQPCAYVLPEYRKDINTCKGQYRPVKEYIEEELLGNAGSVATVRRIIDKKSGKEFARKELLLRDFKGGELTSMRDWESRSIIKMYGAMMYVGNNTAMMPVLKVGLILQLVEGAMTLMAAAQENSWRCPADWMLLMLHQSFGALAEVHGHRITHGDIHGENILNDNCCVSLLDWGDSTEHRDADEVTFQKNKQSDVQNLLFWMDWAWKKSLEHRDAGKVLSAEKRVEEALGELLDTGRRGRFTDAPSILTEIEVICKESTAALTAQVETPPSRQEVLGAVVPAKAQGMPVEMDNVRPESEGLDCLGAVGGLGRKGVGEGMDDSHNLHLWSELQNSVSVHSILLEDLEREMSD